MQADYNYLSDEKLTSMSEWHFNNQSSYKTISYGYDEFDRVTSISTLGGSGASPRVIQYQYNTLSDNSTYNKGYVKEITDAGNGTGLHYNTSENNEAGQVDKVLNYEGSNPAHSSVYTFNEHNQPTQIVVSFPGGQGGSTTTFAYDALGRRNSMTDPSIGLCTFNYNSIGELVSTSKPNGQYAYTYDNMGRLITKTGSGQGVYTYDYVTSGNGLEGLKKITGPASTTEYLYDAFNRPVEKKETIGTGVSAKQFKSSYTYDKYNRIIDYTYPGNFKTTNEYDVNGYLSKIKNNNTVIWQLNSMLTPDLIEEFTNSANVTTHIQYDNSFNLEQIDLGTVSRQTFKINNKTLNMIERRHQKFVNPTDNNELFEYDNFDRLINTKYKDAGNTVHLKHAFDYKANGNFEQKDDCGDYIYANTGHPYQLTQIQNATPNVNLNTLNATYTDFDKVSQITEATSNKQFDFTYGNAEQRVKMEYRVNSQLQYTRYYDDNYDRQETGNNFKEWSYVYAPTGLAAVYYNDNGTGKLYNVTCDHLGSPALLTDNAGQVIEEYSFDAWGRRRDPANWQSYTGFMTPTKMIRGYTGHEQLDEVGIINMNGRIYDPVLGRFIQPDPFVQDPSNIQNFNRYSYVLNNPLKYTDPSGYKIGYNSPYVGSGTSYIGKDGFTIFDSGKPSSSYEGTTSESANDVVVTPYGGTSSSSSGTGGTGRGKNARNNGRQSSGLDLMPTYQSPEMEVMVSKEPNHNKPQPTSNDPYGTSISAIDVGYGFYSSYLYNHSSYLSTKGKRLNFKLSNGKFRQTAQAFKYLKFSKYVTGLGTGISLFSTMYSGYRIFLTNLGTTTDAVDFGVGSFGLGAGVATGFGLISNPVGWGIGIGVSIYGGARLLGDGIGNYNPGGSGVGQFYDSSTGRYMIK